MNKHSQTAAWRESAPVPCHVAIIMDGNGRWAEQRGLPRSAGHRMGVEAVRRTVRAAMELGLQYLTIYSFSSENWARPASEVDDLMGLMRRFIRRDLAELNDNGVRISVIGERDRVDSELLPTPICSSAPAGNCGCRIFCCGNQPTPSSCSSTRSGPTSGVSCCSRQSTSSVGAIGGSAA